jgi:hypothetical protein
VLTRILDKFKNKETGEKGGKTMTYKRDIWDKYPELEYKHYNLAKLCWDIYEATEKKTVWGRRRLGYIKDYATYFKKYLFN